MKSIKSPICLFLVIFLLILTNCTKKEVTNPFDEGCPKELFTPSDFKAEKQGTAVMLSWSQANKTINGFVINRNENDGTMAEVARVDKAITTWSDTKVMGGTKYGYQLYAYAGANLSNPLQVYITTPVLGATVTTVSAASAITPNSAVLGGNVTGDGGAAITERGICYGTSVNPTIANSKVVIGNGTGIFSSTVTGLAANTTYYAKAYATNSYGTAYGTEITFTTAQLSLATVSTTEATSVGTTSVILGGNVTNDGGVTVTERGICHGTSQNPTIANTKLAIGTGPGTFSNTIIGLTAGTIYYAKAYAINSQGTAYGSQITFTTVALLQATVTTTTATSVGTTSAILGGNVTSDGGATVTERGICYSTTQNPTIANSKLAIGTGPGTFSNTVTGLTAGTIYYAKAYAINSQGTAYGSQITFTTISLSLATVTTTAAATVTAISAVLGGNVTNDGGATVTERGVCYSTSQNPTTATSKLAIGTGTGTFSNTVTGLTEGTIYYAKAYAINSLGTAYGTQITFTTSQHSLATVTTSEASNITGITVVLGGNVTNDGNATVTERGVCFSITENPTTGNTKFAIGNGTGAFSNTASSLTESTTYYARAYAINSKGTAYGNQITFKTGVNVILASLSTTAATSITTNSAVLGGNVTDDGGGVVTERGICYKGEYWASSPTINDTKVAVGSGIGLFTTTISGLAANTAYEVRAYVKNSAGVAYGPEVVFTTSGSLPTVTTKDVSNILETSSIAGGIVLSDEGSAVTERGICYGNSTNPTIYDNKIASGSGIGGFNCPLNTLVPNTTYYVRAYATNKNGTAYGENKTFKTLDAYYAGFENGLPAGWSGMWTVSSDTPYEGFSCIKSVNVNDSVSVTINITNPSGGQISFFHKSEGGSSSTYTEFYIDNYLQATIGDEGWTIHAFAINQGTHKFKWRNKGGGSLNNIMYIDYVICQK